MQQNKRPTRASELRIEEWTVPLDLAVRICGFHPRGASSTVGLSTILQSSKVFYYFEIDSMQQNKRPTSGSQLGIDTWSIPVGLAASPGFDSRTVKGFGQEQCQIDTLN